MMTILAALLLLLGALVLLAAALGLHVLPDALSRQHAATMAATLAVIVTAVGAGVMAASWGWSLRLLLIVVFMLLTLPVASHMLARAAVAGKGLIAERDHKQVVRFPRR